MKLNLIVEDEDLIRKTKKGQQMDYQIMHWISSLDEKAKKRKEDENQ